MAGGEALKRLAPRRLLKVAGSLAGVAVLGLALFDRMLPDRAVQLALRLERARAGLKEGRAQVDGFSVSYLDGGAGEPLLLIHGIGADKDNFTRVAQKLTGRFRVIAVDQPGFGESSRNLEASYTIPEQVERLRSLVRSLGLRRVHLGGSSMGGWISALWAAKYPDEVASLWLLDPAGVKHAKESEMIATYRAQKICTLMARTPEEFARVLGVVMEKQPWIPSSLLGALAARAVADYPLHFRIFESLLGSTFLDEDGALGKISAPTLIVWGDKDRALDVSGAELFHQGISKSELAVMPGLGHLPMLEDPAATAERYLAFRDGLAGAR